MRPCAPDTLRHAGPILGILSRLKRTGKFECLYSKMRIYNGENLKDTDPKAKPISRI